MQEGEVRVGGSPRRGTIVSGRHRLAKGGIFCRSGRDGVRAIEHTIQGVQRMMPLKTKLLVTWDFRCRVTLAGQFHSQQIVKRSLSLVGTITSASIGELVCSGSPAASVVLLTETLPWHVRYDSFEGRLPAIQAIKLSIVGAAVVFDLVAMSKLYWCLFRTTESTPLSTTVSVDNVRGQFTPMNVAASIPTDDVPDTTSRCDDENVSAELFGAGAVEDGGGGLLFVSLI
jgi:hypothetical protein